jgi:glycosyltransferase involved in cell wall biosynthesis
MRIQLIGSDNGFGLSEDARVLRSVLDPLHEVHFTPWQSPRRQVRYDANIFLELINPAFFPQARVNYGFLNPEWTMPGFVPHLRRLDLILCKTKDALECFRGHGGTHYTGFTSRDRRQDAERSKRFFHLAGGSQAKGTSQVLEVFRKHPEFTLELVGDRYVPKELPPNVVRHGRLTDGHLNRLMNECMIHLCPSSYEGFGHYINEARSVGALIVTTHAAPMNELAPVDFAIGVPFDSVSQQNLAMHKHVNIEALEEMVVTCAALDEGTIMDLGEKAREAYLSERGQFIAEMLKLFP